MEIDPSARVQLRAVNQLQLPACCAMCGNGTCQRGYVDPAIFYEYDGQVYFCMNCAEEMAKAIGCLLPDESEVLQNLSKDLAEQNGTLRKELEDVKLRVDLYDSIIASVATSAGSSDSSNQSPTDEQPADESANKSADGGAGEKSVVLKSTKSRRPHDAARITSSDKSGFAL